MISASVRADPIDDIARAALEKSKIPGMSVAVVKDGKVIKAAGYGFANLETKTPARADSVYQIGSVTKQFTATAVLMLHEEGKIGLDDPLSKYLPDVPETWKLVTIRQLLTHTSGIKSYTNVKDFEKTLRKDFTPKELLATVEKEPLEFAPGTKWDYSNTGYFLLGLVIEKASGKPYAAFMTERIFQPLGMTATRINDLRAVVPNRATGYSQTPEGIVNGGYTSPTQPFAAGAILSTVNDLAKWDLALTAGKLLKADSWKAAWTPVTLADGKTVDYGFGWNLDERKGHKRVHHGGGIPGFLSYALRLPDDKLTVIVLTNSDGADLEPIANRIAAIYVPALAPEEKKAIADPQPEVTKRLRGIVEKLAKGGGDKADFTKEMQDFLFPDRIKEGPQMVGKFGPLKSFDLTARTEEKGVRKLEYRAVFADAAVLAFITLTADDKIAGIGFRPAE